MPSTFWTVRTDSCALCGRDNGNKMNSRREIHTVEDNYLSKHNVKWVRGWYGQFDNGRTAIWLAAWRQVVSVWQLVVSSPAGRRCWRETDHAGQRLPTAGETKDRCQRQQCEWRIRARCPTIIYTLLNTVICRQHDFIDMLRISIESPTAKYILSLATVIIFSIIIK